MTTVEGKAINIDGHDNEAKKRNRFLISVRWIASFLLLSFSIFCLFYQLPFNWYLLLSVSLFISIYNLIFFRLCMVGVDIEKALVYQISLDWISLFLVCLLTNGINSPFLFLYPIHSALAGFQADKKNTFMLAIISSIQLGFLFLFGFLFNHANYTIITYVMFSIIFCVNLFIIFIARYASNLMTSRLETVSRLKDNLYIENQRLQSVYDLTLDINSTLDVSTVLSVISKAVTRIKPIVVGVIRLLSDNGKTITIMSVEGLKSEPDMGSVALESDLIDFEAVTTLNPVYAPDVTQDSRFLYKDEALRENLVSLLAVPMIHYGKALGVLRCYTNKIYDFSNDEVEFLKLVASESALSITNSVNHQVILDLDKSRSAFIRFATHELRAPMAAVQSILQLVLDGYTGEINSQQKKLFERANLRIEQLLRLVKELLELEGSGSKIKLDFQTANIRDILARTINELSPKADIKHIRLKLNILTNPINILCNVDSLYRVFENLVDNAIKYTPHGGKVDVAVTESDSCVTVDIIDNGIGIPSDEIGKLFSEFFRATNAKETQIDGTGLGLSIVKKIVDNHNGTINVSSVEGVGTTISVTLPKSLSLA